MLGASISSLLYFTSSAQAAEQALLQYADRRITVPLTELKTLAEGGELSPELAAFIQKIPIDGSFERQLLTQNLPVRFAPSGDSQLSRNAQFILYQIDKLIGSPSGVTNYEGLRSALFEASQNQREFTVLGVMDAYPEDTVRVDLRQIERVHADISLFLERLQPLFQSTHLINDWLCECAAPATAETTSHSAAPCELTDLNHSVALVASSSLAFSGLTSSRPESSGAAADPSAIALAASPNKQLVVTFGPLGRSISIEELAEFAETGEPSRRLSSFLKLTNVEPAEFQAALNKPVKVNFRTVERAFSTVLGEYVLFRIGDVVHTKSEAGNILALRSALVLSAYDGQITPIEVMQRYPTPELYIDGLALLRVSKLVQRTLSQDFSQVTEQVTDWLETLQIAIAGEICNCEAPSDPEL
ncbi:MAG: alpha/beta hydrolase [Pegethrix bostrychoides GSE-TBD4-15B]|uniref:Alpha/beta hydrolase n=1 Tax=Pegethrix bostrychoides GSE-TBD4-15B TaxID=2839662 RepID=A0A951PF09_9CYAN|nr:alpha/beta hydrolase [Pegethrix bostrychoides GSE-TBD4-15B]